jgi:hypothetical protein
VPLLLEALGRVTKRNPDELVEAWTLEAPSDDSAVDAETASVVGYESDLEMYRRICEWMGQPFDPALLPPAPLRKVDRIIAEHTLEKTTFTVAEFEEEALPHLLSRLASRSKSSVIPRRAEPGSCTSRPVANAKHEVIAPEVAHQGPESKAAPPELKRLPNLLTDARCRCRSQFSV